MTKIIIPIACFVLAGLLSGCQDNVSVRPVNQIKNNSAESNQNSEENKTTNTPAPSVKNSPTVIAYYFDRTMRCPTCLAIEANAARIIKDNFSQLVAEGSLIWIPYNLDDPGGKEFEKEFDVSVSTLVLSKMKDSNHPKYKKLEKVWDLIGNSVKFDEYVQTEVRQFLNE